MQTLLSVVDASLQAQRLVPGRGDPKTAIRIFQQDGGGQQGAPDKQREAEERKKNVGPARLFEIKGRKIYHLRRHIK